MFAKHDGDLYFRSSSTTVTCRTERSNIHFSILLPKIVFFLLVHGSKSLCTTRFLLSEAMIATQAIMQWTGNLINFTQCFTIFVNLRLSLVSNYYMDHNNMF